MVRIEFRPGQERVARELLDSLEEKKYIMLQAPAGFGKTLLVLYSLFEFMREKFRVLWAVRTGNVTDRPIEELVRFKKAGMAVPAISFRGKRDMCLLAKRGKAKSYEGVEILCKLKRKECPYYLSLEDFDFIPEGPMTFSSIYSLAKKNDICPYYLQHKALPKVKLLSLSYNYVFTGASWSVRRAFPFSKSVLVIDEAHNLQRLAYDLNSDYISNLSLSRCSKEAQKLGAEIDGIIEGLRRAIKKVERRMAFNEATFKPSDLMKEAGLNERELFKMLRMGERVQRLRVEEGKEPRSSLHHLARFLINSLERENEDGVAFLATREGRKIRLEMRDMRASEYVSDVWPQFYKIIFMSGTLRPVDAFSETMGIDEYSYVEGDWRYDYSNIRSIIVKGVTTKGEDLDEEMKEKYLSLIGSLLKAMSNNTAIFTSSYRILEKLKGGVVDMAKDLGIRVFVEEQGMSGRKAKSILEEFRTLSKGLLLASCTGRFAEGVDLPGEALLATMLIGIPFDKPSLATKLFISYYKKVYGPRGRFYAYVLPAFRRISQALGRVIRREGEGGIFILADRRYSSRSNFRLLPKYIRRTSRSVGLEQFKDEVERAFLLIRA